MLKKIQKLQITFGNEKKVAGQLYKDYINSLTSFPQWLTIFSGIAGVLNIFNKIFLIFAFIAFLLSSFVLLYVKKIVSKEILVYIEKLNLVLKETSNFSRVMVCFAKNEINEEKMKKEENQFITKLEEKRKVFI